MSGRGARRLARIGAALVSKRRAWRLAFTAGNEVRLYSSGAEYFAALIDEVDRAQETVTLETYIYCDDEAGRPVSDALVRAARRGVRVRVITDGLGTGRLPLFEQWAAAGVEHRIYNAGWLGVFGRFGLSRTHRKLAVVDARVGFCGGINVVDDFAAADGPLAHPRWDFAVGLTGPVVARIDAALDTQWRRLALGHRPYAQAVPRALALREQASSTGAAAPSRRARGTPEQALKAPSIAFIARDNFVNRRAIEKAYLVAIGRARREILLANPYFVPGRKLRRALVAAARRGVEVRLLIGRKEFAALDYAVPYLYRTFLNAGARIAEYEKTMLHGKVAVVDSNWATVGSSNLDALSLVLNNEANVVLVEHPEIGLLREAILEAFGQARAIDPASYAARPWAKRLTNWLAYAAYRAAMKLLTVGGYD
ncbi:phospholipase D-like domain-containing protein [Trinickia diaoshuihuensis]|jgi:cardiolipin synthase|uniref:phospholipase D-like domain-containing protein n=1 Tax=Trinickia diaoshuihuensis TaxID=2292265 RepID=UPI000E24B0E7|nr:phospholipase D-like domain-containing protein [Trinickia diaoshuihuensis]